MTEPLLENVPPEIVADRLILRWFRTEDAQALATLAADRRIADTTARLPHPYTLRHVQEFIRQRTDDEQSGHLAFAVTSRSNDQLVGAIGLRLESLDDRAELGYWIGVPYWGRGFATEAAGVLTTYGFQSLGLHRITAACLVRNPASRRVLEKVGFRHEGTLREHLKKWERYEDLETFGLLKSEHQRYAV